MGKLYYGDNLTVLRNEILTIRELFEGKQPNIPLVDSSAFKKAPKESVGSQDELPF